MMGAESVEYHRATVLGRADDHPGMALEYYASRGETPLVWGGSGRAALGLDGRVTAESYEAVFGPGGAKDPRTGEQLVRTRRPGMEVVISAHKSVAELGVIGRAEDMHQIMDSERDATLAYLHRVTREMGGRRGEASQATPTGGLIYAHTRHATSRAGDPCPHDHILLANLLEMKDEQGGCKAADTALWREHLHAATMAGRLAAARVAMELGYKIEPDQGPSGRLGHWKIAGVPDEAMAVHSKRAAEIEAECRRRGDTSHQARGVAARSTRNAKRHEPEGQLLERWRSELAEAGWPLERIEASVEAARHNTELPARLTIADARRLVAEVLAPDGDLARRKVFSRRHLVVALAPHLYGQAPGVLDGVLERALADPEVVPLVAVAGARETVHSLASVLAREEAIAESFGRQLARDDGPTVPKEIVETTISGVERELGMALSGEQREAAIGICTSGRGAEIVVGVAGAGKTTMLRVVAEAFERCGHQVLGTATSGQAARNLAVEADIDDSRTLASLLWRLDHGQLCLSEMTAIVLDEVGMTDDIDLARLDAYVELAGAKLVLTGDHRQLGAVGPGGALGALVARHPEAVHHLSGNRRQHDPAERKALEGLRAGDVVEAIEWYVGRGRVHAIAVREEALQAAVDAWATDVAAGHETGLYAWRRANVAQLNRRAREWMEETGRLSGPELACAGGAGLRAGDRVVALAANASAGLVTSERATVRSVDLTTSSIVLRTDDGREVRLSGEETSPERLGYGYATTVHRAQGSTTAMAHLFADGGGRELAYVAMSRARQGTHAWAVADDIGQAADDLRRDWSARRTPTWAIDTGLPGSRPGAVAALPIADKARVVAIALAKAREAADALDRLQPQHRGEEPAEARAALLRAEQQLSDLRAGTGAYRGTEAGRAASDLAGAREALAGARWAAEHSPRWRERRVAARESAVAAGELADAEQRWQAYVAPEASRLQAVLHERTRTVEALIAENERHTDRLRGLAELSAALGSDARQFAAGLGSYRDHLDVTGRQAPKHVRGSIYGVRHAPLGHGQPDVGNDLGPDL